MLDGTILVALGKALAHRCQVPYHEDRETEKLLGHRLTKVPVEGSTTGSRDASANDDDAPLLPTRVFCFPNGELLHTNEWPKRLFDEHAVQITEEVWTHENWPDSYNNVQDALQKCAHGITGVYYHKPSMNLVILNVTGEKVGIRSSSLVIPFVGLKKEEAFKLGRLKKAASA